MLKNFSEKSNKAVKAHMKTLTAIFFAYIIAVLIVIIGFGDTLRVYYELPDGAADEEITAICSDESVAKVEKIKSNGSYACVLVKCVGRGSTEFKIKCGENSQQVILETNKFGVIKNLAFGDMPCWRIVVLFTALFFVSVAAVCIIGYLKTRKEIGFSYIQIADLALHIFTLFFGIAGMVISALCMLRPWNYNFSQAISFYSNAMIFFAMLSSPLILIFALLLCISNIQLIRKEGFRVINLLGIGLSFAMIAGLALGVIINSLGMCTIENTIRFTLINTYFGVYNMFICVLVSVFIIFFHIAKHTPEYNKDFIIILGCAIRKDGTLYPLIRGRADKAIEFAEKQKQATGKTPCFIPSGGKGDNEPIAEGRAMADYLISRGIDENCIFPETESKNTIENMKFSVEIANKQKENPNIIFSTTNYHVFRSGILAAGVGCKMDGIGSKTKWYFWPNALIREFFGLLANNKINFIIFCIIVAGVSVLSGLLGN